MRTTRSKPIRAAESLAPADARTNATGPPGSWPLAMRLVQNLRRRHYEVATDIPARQCVQAAFDQLTTAI